MSDDVVGKLVKDDHKDWNWDFENNSGWIETDRLPERATKPEPKPAPQKKVRRK